MTDLAVDNVVKEYPTASDPLRVLNGISLAVSRGDSLAILGPSGSGKSTLLSILGSLEPPTSGTVRLAGQDPFNLDEAQLASFRGEHVGFVFQEHHLLPQCTALENVLIPYLSFGSVDQRQQDRGRALLDRVGLAQRADHRPAELSGGERQRVAIARALVREPTLVLADEPTGNLDRTTAQAIAELLAELPSQHATILVLVTHSLELATIASQRMQLDGGQLVPAA